MLKACPPDNSSKLKELEFHFEYFYEALQNA